MGWLAVYGHVNIDYLLLVKRLPQSETTLPVEKSLVRLGGTGGNIARAAAALGVPTALAACVGDDFPAEYRAQLASGGIDLTDLKHVAGPTPKVWILSVPNGPQSAIIDQGVMGDGHQRPALDYAWMEGAWVHFTTGSPHDWAAVARDAREAKKHIAFDPAQELSYRYTSRVFEDLLNRSHVLWCNEHELPRALDLLGYGDPHQLFDHVERIIVTRGAQGTRLLTPKESHDVPACPVRGRDHVETTGAGDVLRAGVYAGLHRGQSWPEALRTGSCASSLFLEAQGERFPSWDAVAARRQEWTP